MNEPRYLQREAFRVVGMKITANPATPDIPALWQKFAPRMFKVPDTAEPKVSYGVMQNFDPQKGTLEYMAGVSVESIAYLPDGMTSIDMPPNTYAVFEATMATIEQVFCQIYETWLPKSNFDHAKAPYFERYDERFDPTDRSSLIEVFIPVKVRAPQPKEFV